jgi:hypothetical protein
MSFCSWTIFFTQSYAMNRFHPWHKPRNAAESRVRRVLHGLLRFALGIAGVSSVSTALSTPVHAPDRAHSRLDERVEAVRAVLDSDLQNMPMTTEDSAKTRIAQYWPNWPKWQKWFNSRS